MNFSSFPNNFNVNIETPWEFIRSVLLWFWGIVTTDFINYGSLSFSIFDVFIGFTILGIILRLVFLRMHLATAVGTVRALNANSDSQRASASYLRNKEQYMKSQNPDFIGPMDPR